MESNINETLHPKNNTPNLIGSRKNDNNCSMEYSSCVFEEVIAENLSKKVAQNNAKELMFHMSFINPIIIIVKFKILYLHKI